MTDLTRMFNWNASFVRGLAQSVLERAKVIRGSLPYVASPTGAEIKVAAAGDGRGKGTNKKTAKKSIRRSPKRAGKTAGKKTKRTHG